MRPRAPIRVLVIDDSPHSQRLLRRILEGAPGVEVVGVARDGREALRKTVELHPDLVTLDLEMPRMDGFTFLRLLMAERPTPVVVVSGHSRAEDVFRALELGAVDFVAKPVGSAEAEREALRAELLRKVEAIRELRPGALGETPAAPPTRRAPRPQPEAAPRAVALGASTGGPAALMRVFAAFDEAPPCPLLVAQHMPAGFTAGFAERVARLSPLRAREARSGDLPEPGLVLVAPGGRHLELECAGGRLAVRVLPPAPGDRYVPSVDLLFRSAAKHYGSGLLAVVLTGMGDDGCDGARSVHAAGGAVIAEAEESAVVFGMPRQAIQSGAVTAVLPLGRIADAIRSGLPRADTRRAAGGKQQ